MHPEARSAWAAARPGQGHAGLTACVAPWVSMEFDPAGWVLACCAGHMYPLGRVGDQPLREIWNGERAEALRDALRGWDLTVACVACRYHLERGRLDPVAAVYDVHELASPEPRLPVTMQFALGNRCNLGCVMCNAELSSRLRVQAGLAPVEDRYNDSFFEELAPMLQDLQLAKFQGGEPFLIPAHRRVWELLAALPQPPRVLVTTNGTVWNDTVEMVLDRFDVDVSISVDAATAATYEGIRVGSDWNILMDNVDRFDRAAQASGGSLHVSFCLMDRNWHELPAFLSWAERFGVPASVNLVTDAGLALHDLSSERLREVARIWRSDPASRSLELNAGVWATQMAQLDAVLALRAQDVRSVPVQPRPWRSDVGWRSQLAAHVAATPVSVDAEIAALRRWSGSDEVAAVFVDSSGVIADIAVRVPSLGIDVTLIGSPIAALPDRIGHVSGRPIWLIDEDVDHEAGRHVRVFAVSKTAARGTPGTVVRTVEFRSTTGSVVCVAADRIQESLAEPVRLRGRSSGSAALSEGDAHPAS